MSCKLPNYMCFCGAVKENPKALVCNKCAAKMKDFVKNTKSYKELRELNRLTMKLNEAIRLSASPLQHARNSAPLNVVAGGSLNPTWVEWLMGWPLGWTDLKPLEMDKFRQWQRSHGRC